jgi:hypothetical protein
MTSNYLLTSYDQDTAFSISAQAKILLAEMLPGCTARRFDLPDPCFGGWDVDVCFADHGPIVPELMLWHNPPYFTRVSAYMVESLMIMDPNLMGGQTFSGPRITMTVPLETGPEAIARTLHDRLIEADYKSIVAAGTIERILAERPRLEVPWPSLRLALCAVYLGKDDEAEQLILDALRYADRKGRESYTGFGPLAESYLSKLNEDPDQLRKELIATMNHNWSHYKVISR